MIKPSLNRDAYLGKQAQQLILESSAQVAEVYITRGIVITVECSSTLDTLYRHQPSSLSELARALNYPHQLIAQRLSKLVKLGLVTREADPEDGRRMLNRLTDKGVDQAQRLTLCMEDMAEVYRALYAEIECDLPAKLKAARDAMQTQTLVERFAATFPNRLVG